MRENMIDHLAGFIEQKEVPAILGKEELDTKIRTNAMKSQQSFEHLRREFSSLEAGISDTPMGKDERENKFVISSLSDREKQLVTNSKNSARRSDIDYHKGRHSDQQNLMATVKNLLFASKDEHDIGKEELINIVRTLFEKVNQLELERDLIEFDKSIVDKKILKTQKRLDQRKRYVRWQSGKHTKIPFAVTDWHCIQSPEVTQVPKRDLLHTDNLQIPKLAMKNNSKKTKLNIRKRVSKVKREFLDGKRKSFAVDRKENSRFVERPINTSGPVWKSKYKNRLLRENKTFLGNVDTNKTSFRQRVGLVERAFTRKDTNLAKEQMRDLFHNVTPVKVIV